MTLSDAFICALVAKRHDPEIRSEIRCALRIRREKKQNSAKWFRLLPALEPPQRYDLRMIDQ